jgi:hypothetical protein
VTSGPGHRAAAGVRRSNRVLRAAVLCCALAAGCSREPPASPASPAFADPAVATSGKLAVVGDLQETLWVERLLRRERDEAAPARLIADLAREKPGLLVLLGDLVAVGSSQSDWRRLDALLAPVRAAGIPGLAVLGNHEYWGRTDAALRHAAARFPQLGRGRWYARMHGPLALVFLDSNRSALGEEAWAGQGRFLSDTLRALDGDARVKGIVVFDHHPPFTNSTTTPDEEAAESFVGPFRGARKAIAFVSGHAHAYERFVEGGRTFVVSGGGGGPRVQLLEGERRRHLDLAPGGSPRPFHYLLLEPGPSGVEVAVRGFPGGDAKVAVVDRFRLPYAN